MGAADQSYFDRLRRQYYPPDRNRVSAHLTLFHHLPPSVLVELSETMRQLALEPPPRAEVSGLIHLGKGVAYRVDSPDLLDMRQYLAERFSDLLIPQDRAKPRLHITVQNKVIPAEAKILFDQLSADFQPRPLSITGLAAYYYRDGLWDEAFAVSFRGTARR
jgi:hypothetical protein